MDMNNNIATQVYWERNSLVLRNSNIDPERVFSRCPTNEFPFDSVSVRINNQSKGIATVYFRDPIKTRSYGSGKNKSTYTYCDSTLRVTLPLNSSWNKEDYNYTFQGCLPTKYDLYTFASILQYVRSELEKMSGITHSIPYANI